MATHPRPLRIVAALLLASALGLLLVLVVPETRAHELGQRQVLELVPGQERLLRADGLVATVAVPEGEGHSWGTMILTARGPDGRPGAELVLERDGSLVEAWAADLDRDGAEDLLLVTRAAGSGAYLDLTLVRATPEGLAAEPLPGIDSASFPGYMGHGRVEVVDGAVELEFPLYGQHLEWDEEPLEALARGDLPVSFEPDPNVRPTDGRLRVCLDLAARVWRRVGSR